MRDDTVDFKSIFEIRLHMLLISISLALGACTGKRSVLSAGTSKSVAATPAIDAQSNRREFVEKAIGDVENALDEASIPPSVVDAVKSHMKLELDTNASSNGGVNDFLEIFPALLKRVSEAVSIDSLALNNTDRLRIINKTVSVFIKSTQSLQIIDSDEKRIEVVKAISSAAAATITTFTSSLSERELSFRSISENIIQEVAAAKNAVFISEAAVGLIDKIPSDIDHEKGGAIVAAAAAKGLAKIGLVKDSFIEEAKALKEVLSGAVKAKLSVEEAQKFSTGVGEGIANGFVSEGVSDSEIRTVVGTEVRISHVVTLSQISTLSGATEDTSFSISFEAIVAASDLKDIDGTQLSLVVKSVDTGVLKKDSANVVEGSTTLLAGESLQWTPALNANGELAAFSVLADDGLFQSAAVQVKVQVAAANDAPTLTTISAFAAIEDTQKSISYATLLAASNASDVDGDLIQFRIESVNSGLLFKNSTAVTAGVTLISVGDTLSWTPVSNTNGTVTAFTIRVFDGTESSQPAVSVSMNVSAIDDAPTLTTVATLTGATEDTPFTISYATLKAASDAADVEGDAISFKIVSVSSGTITKNAVSIVAGSTTLSVGESLVWTPASDENGAGVNAFTVVATDGIETSTSAVQVKVSVGAVNDAPTVSAISNVSTKSGSAIGNISFTVDEGGGPDEDAQNLTITATSSNTSLVPDANISVFYTADGASDATGGTLSIAPLLSTGSSVITLTVSDGTLSSQTNFTVTVSSAAISTTGLAVWVAADSSVTKDSNNLVSSWHDISTNALDFAQSVDANKPTWIADGGQSFNHQPVLRFNGSTNVLDAGNVLNSVLSGAGAKFTIFAVVKGNDTAALKQIFTKSADSACSPAENNRQFSFVLDSNEKLFFVTQFLLAPGWYNYTVGALDAGLVPKILVGSYNGQLNANNGANRIQIFVNGQRDPGTQVHSGSLSNIPASNAKLSIGGAVCASGYYPTASLMDGDIAEIIVYGRDLSEFERQNVEGYLANKYDINVLPASNQALWLRADKGLYQDSACTSPIASNNESVACWLDQSGNSNNVTQVTGAAQPVYQQSSVNNKPSLHFDSVDDALTKSNVASLTTMFGVAKKDVALSPREWWYFVQKNSNLDIAALVTDNNNDRLRLWSAGANGLSGTVNAVNTLGGNSVWLHTGIVTDFVQSLYGNGNFWEPQLRWAQKFQVVAT